MTLKFKDEFAKNPNQYLIVSEPRLYFILSDDKQKRSAKGVSQSAHRKFKHELYRQVLLTGLSFRATNSRIGSVNHQLQTIRTTQVSFSCIDDKRLIKEDGNTGFPLGHYGMRDNALHQDILDDVDWGEDSTPPVQPLLTFYHLGGCQSMKKLRATL